jgi:predicted NBD/HSP70 family sugar kinase
MYLAIDIGGSKTFVGLFDASGKKIIQKKFKTNENYQVFISDLEKCVAKLPTNNLLCCACAVPGLLDREAGMLKSLGNLPWVNCSIRDDISRIIGGAPVIIENDAKIAGLAESEKLNGQYKRVLYMTISTGIGVSYLENGILTEALLNMELGKMPLPYEGKVQQWEEFASGRAMVKRYGLMASEIKDPVMWEEIGERLSYGVGVCCSVLQPEAIVFGGGAGKYSEKFAKHIKEYLVKNLHPITEPPRALLPAHYGNDSVVHGCYILLKQKGKIA